MEKPLRVSTPGDASGSPARPAGSGSGASTPGKEAHVTWDEETIAQHDLERGTRMKIDEPNTPFHYYRGSELEREDRGDVSPARSVSGKEGQGLEWNELESKLLHAQSAKKSDWDSSDEEDAAAETAGPFAERDAEGRKLVHDPKFAEKRKMHYNEFERVRAWKMQHANDEDEDEDESKPEAKTDK